MSIVWWGRWVRSDLSQERYTYDGGGLGGAVRPWWAGITNWTAVTERLGSFCVNVNHTTSCSYLFVHTVLCSWLCWLVLPLPLSHPPTHILLPRDLCWTPLGCSIPVSLNGFTLYWCLCQLQHLTHLFLSAPLFLLYLICNNMPVTTVFLPSFLPICLQTALLPLMWCSCSLSYSLPNSLEIS